MQKFAVNGQCVVDIARIPGDILIREGVEGEISVDISGAEKDVEQISVSHEDSLRIIGPKAKSWIGKINYSKSRSGSRWAEVARDLFASHRFHGQKVFPTGERTFTYIDLELDATDLLNSIKSGFGLFKQVIGAARGKLEEHEPVLVELAVPPGTDLRLSRALRVLSEVRLGELDFGPDDDGSIVSVPEARTLSGVIGSGSHVFLERISEMPEKITLEDRGELVVAALPQGALSGELGSHGRLSLTGNFTEVELEAEDRAKIQLDGPVSGPVALSLSSHTDLEIGSAVNAEVRTKLDDRANLKLSGSFRSIDLEAESHSDIELAGQIHGELVARLDDRVKLQNRCSAQRVEIDADSHCQISHEGEVAELFRINAEDRCSFKLAGSLGALTARCTSHVDLSHKGAVAGPVRLNSEDRCSFDLDGAVGSLEVHCESHNRIRQQGGVREKLQVVSEDRDRIEVRGEIGSVDATMESHSELSTEGTVRGDYRYRVDDRCTVEHRGEIHGAVRERCGDYCTIRVTK